MSEGRERAGHAPLRGRLARLVQPPRWWERALTTELTPAQRSLRARLAAHSLHAKVRDPAAHTAPARQAFLSRFEREVDPEGVLPVAERQRRAEHARKAYFTRLGLAAARARRKS